uniref:Reverse transcriptase domain-containing protein n=1 Tax=Echeneis naucrates TaxID=173247 RepID=A0A665X235_ECHNA
FRFPRATLSDLCGRLLYRPLPSDTLDHQILLDRLENFFGISVFNNTCSESCTVRYGVPQGSVLGPLLISLYLAPLDQLLHSFNVDFHCYADDLQLYMPLAIGDGSNKQKCLDCLDAVKSWLSANFLNSAKTDMLLIRPSKWSHLPDMKMTVLFIVETELGILVWSLITLWRNNMLPHAYCAPVSLAFCVSPRSTKRLLVSVLCLLCPSLMEQSTS